MATQVARRAPKPKGTVLRPVHPNSGIEAEYRRRMVALIAEMDRSISYWLKAAYRRNSPELAQDELPVETLRRAIRALTRRWQAKFNDLAGDLASYFAQSVSQRSDAALKAALKKGGFTVEFKMTRTQRDVLNAVTHENVALIKSIPAQHLQKVEGAVMRSVSTGRDLGALTKELQQISGVTRKRAAFIAQSQNNLATAAITAARQREIGITEAIWVHSGGGAHPRKSHLKAGKDGQRFDPAKGWLDPEVGQYILPGQLPRCRCVSKAVVPGFG